jgi:hypothetical protein
VAGTADPQPRTEADDDRHLILGDLAPAGGGGAGVDVAAVAVDDPQQPFVGRSLHSHEPAVLVGLVPQHCGVTAATVHLYHCCVRLPSTK